VKLLWWVFAVAVFLHAQTGENVLLVVNKRDPDSARIAEYYRVRRSIPVKNVCRLDIDPVEEISRAVYDAKIEKPIGDFLRKEQLQEKILYIVTTIGIPLKVAGPSGGMSAEHASVDSELTLLYSKLKGSKFQLAGPVNNPLFMKRDAPFRRPQFPIYLVTRLAAYDLADAQKMVDRALAARNRGKFVIDLTNGSDANGNNWLRTAAILLPKDRVILDETEKIVYDQKNVIGYASWGSNDDHRKRRWLRYEWLPGAIATEYVSTNARTLKRPPDDWTFTTWEDRVHWFADSPQSLSADLIHEGATGASGNVYEPYLTACARPDYLIPAYYQGRNLAESYYVALPFLSWQGVVFGDPLCKIGKP
jgi:uncharacterized protein (TIGR03790 family)